MWMNMQQKWKAKLEINKDNLSHNQDKATNRNKTNK